MDHLALVFGFIGRLYAIRCAAIFDFRDIPLEDRQQSDPAALRLMVDRLWFAAWNAWTLAIGRTAYGEVPQPPEGYVGHL